MSSRFLLGQALSGVALCLIVAVVLVACGADTRSSASQTRPPAIGASATPPALRASYLAARQKEGGPAYHFERDATLRARAKNAAHQLDVEIADGAASLTRLGNDGWRLGFRWTGLGRGARIAAVPAPHPEAALAENRASYLRDDGSEEWYESGPLGVEQGFVLAASPAGPAGGDPLAIEVSVEGDLSPALADGGARIDLADARGATVAHYTDLSAFDAGGAALRAWLEVSAGVIRLRVDDTGARYPITIDPVTWTLQQEIAAPTPAAGDRFGASVSVSGALAIIGAPDHDAGAGTAYVFLQTGATWALQQQINAGDGVAGDAFGTSVWVSGATAIVGAPNHAVGGRAGAGAAYVFTQSGATWTQVTPDLTAGDAAAGDAFGTAVSVSGGIAVAGAPNHKAGAGAAYVFAESGAAWPEQAELVAGGGQAGDAFGTSVSVSVSPIGSTALVGAPYHTVGALTEAGAAYPYAQSGASWTQQTALSAGDAASFDGFGTSVAVDGSNALVGAPYHTANGHSEAGAAYPFVLSGGSWSAQTELNAGDGKLGNLFGFSVSVNGPMAIVGAYQHDVGSTVSAGAAYLFYQTCPAWAQQQEVTATDDAPSDFFGYGVAVNGTISIAGAYLHDQPGATSAGAVYVYSGVDSSTPACCIGGTAYAAGAVNPNNPCQACTPATSTSAWSDEPNGMACTGGDVCIDGMCVPPGCVIAGTSYASGETNPADPCQVCNTATSTTAWSDEPNGTSCGAGMTCNNGMCACTPKTCASQGFDCGAAGDGCGNLLQCGNCTAPQTCGGAGMPNVCASACLPKTCASQGFDCGAAADGCAGVLQCGNCTAPQTCGGAGMPNVCGSACLPKTCASQGFDCGAAADGCGGVLQCGNCTAPQTCGGAGTPNVCGTGCVPLTCVQRGFNCGAASDGCGNILQCGTCVAPQTCGGGGMLNVCGIGCLPTTCSQQGISCGVAGDGCGNELNCGTCAAPQTCGGGGVAGQCGCTPMQIRPPDGCGAFPDGCGGFFDCGDCMSPQTCGGGGIPNQCGCQPTQGCAVGSCGFFDDGCGDMIDCGSCADGQVCSANQCVASSSSSSSSSSASSTSSSGGGGGTGGEGGYEPIYGRATCSAAPATSPGSPFAIAGLAGLAGLVGRGARRRRRGARP